MDRRDKGVVGDVRSIIRDIEELKTSQFTSQNSGMIFKQATTLRGWIPFIASTDYAGEVHLVTEYFTPDHNRPAICLPHFEMEQGGFQFEYTHDYAIGYYNISISDADGNYLGYADVWPLMHRREVSDGTYGFQTVVYTWANSTFDIPFTLSLRATDSGTHTVRVESARIG